jgi:hypothetical protein
LTDECAPFTVPEIADQIYWLTGGQFANDQGAFLLVCGGQNKGVAQNDKDDDDGPVFYGQVMTPMADIVTYHLACPLSEQVFRI